MLNKMANICFTLSEGEPQQLGVKPGADGFPARDFLSCLDHENIIHLQLNTCWDRLICKLIFSGQIKVYRRF